MRELQQSEGDDVMARAELKVKVDERAMRDHLLELAPHLESIGRHLTSAAAAMHELARKLDRAEPMPWTGDPEAVVGEEHERASGV